MFSTVISEDKQMYSKKVSKGNHKSIDWMVTLVPFVLILGLSVLLFIFPEKSNAVISQIRFFFGNTMGMYYLVIGLGILLLSFYWGSRAKNQNTLSFPGAV